MTDMRKRKNLIKIIVAVYIFLMLILFLFVDGFFKATLAFIFTILFLVANAILWRCPYCKQHLGRIDDSGPYCQHCGQNIYE